MFRWVRITLTALGFAMFFAGSVMLGALVFPLMLLLLPGGLDRHRDRCTAFLGRGYGFFLFYLKLMGLIDYAPFRPPPITLRGPYVLVANHPSLIDVLFLLHFFSGLTSLVKASLYRSWFVGLLLRSTRYIPGPQRTEEDAFGAAALDRMVAQLRSGRPLVIFPEGTRSPVGGLHRFRRGAFEAAIRASVPLVCVGIRIDRPFLTKGAPFWRVPKARAVYEFSCLGVVERDALGTDAKRLCDHVRELIQAGLSQGGELTQPGALTAGGTEEQRAARTLSTAPFDAKHDSIR